MDDSQKYFYINIRGYLGQEGSNEIRDYQYNELNQLISKKDGNESYTYTYDKRGNRIAETGKKESRARKTEITMQDAENVVDRVIGKLVSCQDV